MYEQQIDGECRIDGMERDLLCPWKASRFVFCSTRFRL